MFHHWIRCLSHNSSHCLCLFTGYSGLQLKALPTTILMAFPQFRVSSKNTTLLVNLVIKPSFGYPKIKCDTCSCTFDQQRWNICIHCFHYMLKMFFETNWWHVNNLTFVSLFITNLLNQEDLTIEMLLYPLQACNTKLSMNFFWTRLFWNNLCHNQKNIDWWRCNTLLFGLLMFYNLSILSLCYCFVLTLEFCCVYFKSDFFKMCCHVKGVQIF